MENRAISISLAVSLAAYLASKLLLKAHTILQEATQSQLIAPLIDILHQSITILPWLIGGATAGYLCTYNPLKHGAITGALYGAAFSTIGIMVLSGQTYETPDKISQLIYAAAFTAKSSFLFSLSSAFGFLTANQRRGL
ncbi:MAG: hypothetical protein ABWY06_08135 [Pseudomonas sp.]|uniref:hypothetical protein n=1 Tax=Pseudomonas sp. TaxID=306 RepID=UPI0033985C5A